jgi:hypothetical protein
MREELEANCQVVEESVDALAEARLIAEPVAHEMVPKRCRWILQTSLAQDAGLRGKRTGSMPLARRGIGDKMLLRRANFNLRATVHH